MRSTSRMTASAARRRSGASLSPGGRARAGRAAAASPSRTSRRSPPGSIHGIVQDERGAPVAGAMVSALGATTAFAVTDRSGRFELRTLSPGPYLVRAHLAGFVASRGQVVDVRPSARASSSIALRHCERRGDVRCPLLAAGVGVVRPSRAGAARGRRTRRIRRAASPIDDDHGEIAWRLRHARRGILKDVDGARRDPRRRRRRPTRTSSATGFFSRACGSPARLATSFFADTPFSGQVNLLTTGSFDTPQQLFTAEQFRAQHRLSRARRAGRRARRLDRARRAHAGRHRVVDRRRRVHDARAGAASLRRRAVVQHAALRRRQLRRAARRRPTAAATPARSTASTPSRSRRRSR